MSALLKDDPFQTLRVVAVQAVPFQSFGADARVVTVRISLLSPTAAAISAYATE
jgi:hypothetical protein